MMTGKEMLTPAYELMYEEELKDSRSHGVVLRHKKSGARICVISNEDDNKVFSVGFRTPPEDSTGVAHIIEHSVLNGSEKYPLKDPFVELIKGSLNTFLNAFTGRDFTMYPVASCNDQDFKNLMSVYMDAAFHPNIYHHEEIFLQEGWHYEVSDEGELTINGVVYNEMKGAFSSPDQVLWREIVHSLYPDIAYGVESGGNPDNIPELTYENFLNFHRRFYHPVNSYIYLYGNMDAKERLTWLDEAYLSKYDRIELDSEVKLQKPFGGCKELVSYYPISEGEDTKGKTYLSYNIMFGHIEDIKLWNAMQILNNVLLSPVGPVYQALVKAGISPNIMSSVDDSVKQPYFTIVAKNTDEDKKDAFLSVLRQEFERIASEGVPERSLRAAINSAEFRYREADYGGYPKGLMMNMMGLSGWMANDNDAFANMHYNDIYAELKKEIGTGYYEELIRKYLLNPEHATVFIMKPEPGLTGKKEKELKEKLAAYKATLSEEELAAIKAKQEQLKKYQDTPDTREAIESLPMLKRSDIRKEALPLLSKERKAAGLNTVNQEVFTNGVAYILLTFDAVDLKKEDIPYLSLLTTVLGYVDSDNYTYREFDNEMNIETGGIYTSIETSYKYGDSKYYRPNFCVAIKTMYDKIAKAYELAEEMLFRNHLDDTVRIKEIIEELRSRKQSELMGNSHSIAVQRALAHQYENAVFNDTVRGIGYFRFLCDLSDHFEEKAAEISAHLKHLCNVLFTKENLIVSVTADSEGIDKALQEIEPLAAKLPGRSTEGDIRFRPANYGFDLISQNEAFTCPGQVQYVAKCGDFSKTGIPTCGTLEVTNKILSMGYFWDRVRVHGGAYGCMTNVNPLINSYMLVSYRDPNLEKTIEVYDKTWEFLRDFEADEREMTKYIIGTFGDADAPLSPRALGNRSLSLFMCGATYEDLQKRRDESLNTTLEDVRAYAPLMKALMEQNNLCVIGSEVKVDGAKELFDSIEPLI